MNTERESQRLLALYADKADEELLELYARRNDLTEVAQQALDQAMHSRGLEPQVDEPAQEQITLDALSGLEPGEISLITFRDGLETAQAVDALRAAELPHRITERVVRYVGGDSRNLLDLVVDTADAPRAREVLQRTLGLFPPPEGEDSHAEDFAPLGEFTAAQAKLVTAALAERSIHFTAEHEDDDPEAPAWISVAADRVDEAFELMEQIADTLPE